MFHQRLIVASIIPLLAAILLAAPLALAVDPPPAPTPTPTSGNTRYGFLGLLDSRSIYGKYWYPEPLRADEADVDNEIRFDSFHGENRGRTFNSAKVELEKSFGLLTLEVAPGYEADKTRAFNPVTRRTEHQTDEGFTNIEIGARYPVFQYVSPAATFDTTFVLGLEVAPPVLSKISKDTEIVPKIFNLTRIGEHLSVQLGLGDSILIGPEDRGLSTLEYDVVLGYELTRKDLPIPGILSTIPIFEIDGEYTLNHDDAGSNQIFGTAGFRFNFDSIPGLPAQPRLGIGYTFPMEHHAQAEFRWGIVVSLVFEY